MTNEPRIPPQGSRFTYDKAYLTCPNAIAISPTLPLQPEPYDGCYQVSPRLLKKRSRSLE